MAERCRISTVHSHHFVIEVERYANERVSDSADKTM